MILTLTPNPTIDRVLFCRNFALDAVVRADREAITPCGKGVNAAMALHEMGEDVLVLGLRAGHTGAHHAHLLDELGIGHDLLSAAGETRTNVVLVDQATSQQSSISAPTLHSSPKHLEGLCEKIDQHAGAAWGLICGGSLPPGLPADSYRTLLERGRDRGLKTLLDTSGQPLRSGVAARPHLLKVNLNEYRDLDPGAPDALQPLTARLEARLGEWAAEAIVVTLGERGAVAVTCQGTLVAVPPAIPVTNTAGAGDALGSGLMLARSRGDGWPQALALGTAAAASVVMNEGTGVCRRDQIDTLLTQIEIRQL